MRAACGYIGRSAAFGANGVFEVVPLLPMPARFVIGTDGIIAYAEVNPDYTQRPDPSELLPVLDRLRASKAA